MSEVQATIVVKFGDDVSADAVAILELDNETNVYVDTKGENQIYTTFAPGYSPHFLLHHDPTLRIAAIHNSSGEVVFRDMFAKRDRTQRLEFIKDKFYSEDASADLTYIPSSNVEKIWYVDPELNEVLIGVNWKLNNRKITIRDANCRIMDMTYTVSFKQFRLDPPVMDLAEDEDFPVLIVFYMENAE